MTLRLYVHQPAVVFAARVNQASFNYPIAEVTYDGVTVGSAGATFDGMQVVFGTSLGADDLGRQRLRKAADATKLYFGRSSQGTRDGEVDLADDVYITVLWQYGLYAKTPYYTPTGTMYKDSDLVVGTNTTTPPPVANTGPPMAGTVDAVTDKLRVQLPPSVSNTSFAVSDGATIASYAWSLPSGVTLVGGYALTDAVIQVDCDPGFYYVRLTVTDSNGKTHQARTFIYARDPAADTTIATFQIESHRITPAGQAMNIRVSRPLAATTYPDGALVVVFDGEPSGPTDRSHMLFWGFHHTDPASIQATRTGTLQDVTLNCLDVAGKLDTLMGVSQSIQAKTTPVKWIEMVSPNIDKLFHYLLYWGSTALEITDFAWSGVGASYPFAILETGGESLWDQVNRKANTMVPSYQFVCNRRGQLAVIVDPMLQDTADRTATIPTTIANMAEIRYIHQRPPRVHWLRSSAVLTGTTFPLRTAFCIAPGEAPGQGETAQDHGEQLAISQAALNAVTGHRYARLNAPQGYFNIVLSDGDRDIEPADMTWVGVTISAAVAAQRGLTFTQARGLVRELNIRYSHERGGLVRTAELVWERETSGSPAVTVVQPVADNLPTPVEDWWPDDYWDTNPVDLVPNLFFGSIKGYVLWDGAHVMRTWDLLAASPTWELIDTGISGTILDGQYVMVTNSQVGMWLMTSTAIYWCADIMATTPSWTSKLTLATVQAADAAPGTGSVVFKAMSAYFSAPGYLIVATGPDNITNVANWTYAHSYTWHTFDYGANWSQVDMDGFTETDSGYTAAYCGCGRYGIDIYRSSPVIWCVRSTPSIQDTTAVFKSIDLGDTWTKEYSIADFSGDLTQGPAILTPFPSIGDRSYMNRGNPLGGVFGWIYTSDDAWATGAQQSKPAGYSGTAWKWRPNSRTDDPDHCLALWRNTSTFDDVLESLDGGATWSLLYASGLASGSLQTPNGWPPQPETWILIRTSGTLGATTVRYTEDNFGSLISKEGNLSTILAATWTAGDANGFALPKVPPNV